MVTMNSNVKVTGKVEIFSLTGELMYSADNLVVDTGLNYMVDRMKVNTPDPVSHIAVGTDNTVVTAGDTALGVELARKAATDIDTALNVLTVETQFEDPEAIGHWYEAAIFNASSGGVMINRVNIDFIKDTTDAVVVKFTITYTAS